MVLNYFHSEISSEFHKQLQSNSKYHWIKPYSSILCFTYNLEQHSIG